MKSKENKFKKVTLIPMIIGAVLFVLYKNADSKLEQLMLGGMFVMNILPFVLHLTGMLLVSSAVRPKEQRIAENLVGQNKNYKIESKDSIKTQYKTKTNTNPNYIEVRNRLIDVVKNGVLNRDSILKFKLELDNKLDINRYAYSNFDFENDMHEIYIKLKSSKLKDEDYQYLKAVIEDLIG